MTLKQSSRLHTREPTGTSTLTVLHTDIQSTAEKENIIYKDATKLVCWDKEDVKSSY